VEQSLLIFVALQRTSKR